MSLHLNLSTGKFLNSSTLFKLSDALLLDVSSGEIVMSNLLVPRAGVDLFKLASLDLNFAQYKALTDRVSGNNLVTFSRASSGTYVGSDGLIKTSPVNLVTYSEEFDQSGWTPINGGSITPNNETSPDGTQSADELVGGVNVGLVKNINTNNTRTYTASGFVKASTDTTGELRIGQSGNYVEVQFDLSAVTFSTIQAGTATGVSGGIQSVGDGWYRVHVTATSIGTAASNLVFYGNIYLWGAQLEEGTLTDYIPTGATKSGAPRFDHDPVTGESLGLLIEESRTNLLPASDNFLGWSTEAGNQTVTANATIDPAGTNNASKLTVIDTPGGNNRKLWITGVQNANLVVGQPYTFSVFIKAVSGQVNTGYLHITTGANDTWQSSTGFVATAEWQRVSVSINSAQDTLSRFLITGDPAAQLFIWGAQIEQASFPTSYIPTSGSTVTRSPDIASIEGNEFAKTNLLEYSERFDQVKLVRKITINYHS